MEIKYENVNGTYYDKIEKALIREDCFIVHPRTRELIIGCTRVETPKPIKKHLRNCPRVRYHRAINRIQRSGQFIVAPRLLTLENPLSPTDTAQLNYTLKGDLTFKDTGQWKSVFYQRNNRRQ